METTKLDFDARDRAKMLSANDVSDGSPEKALMGARRMKGLWNARSHDLDSWRTAIDWIAPEDAPKAWERLPDSEHPYGTARAFIEAEVHPSYEKLLSYVEIMLGIEWAKRIAENYRDRPGAPEDNSNAHAITKNNPYAHKDCFSDSSVPSDSQYGTRKEYLLERLPAEVAAQVGEDKQYKTVFEAARKTGIINVPLRFNLPGDPGAAGSYLAERVDRQWFETLIDSYYKAIES